jgi:hypothetical protein
LENSAQATHTNWQDLDPSQVQLATSHDWLALWDELGGVHGEPPTRAALNLPAQRPALCKLALWIQLLDDGDYLFRIAGEEVRQRFGTRLAGRRLSELPLGEDAHDIRRCYQAAERTRAPTCARGFYDFGQGPETRWEACFLPFTGAESRVGYLLAGLAYA